MEEKKNATIKAQVEYIKQIYWLLRQQRSSTIPQQLHHMLFRIVFGLENAKEITAQLQPIRMLLTNYLHNASPPHNQSHFKSLLKTNLTLAIIQDYLHDASAEHYYEQALSFDRDNPQICLLFAWFFFRSGKVKSAIEYAKRIKIQNVIEEEHIQAVDLIIKCRLLKFDVTTVNRNSSNPFEVSRADFIVLMSEFAAEFYRKRVEEQPENCQNYPYLMRFLNFLGRKEECLKWMEIMCKANPRDQYQIRLLGVFSSLYGKKEESIEYLKEAIVINPKDERTYSSLILSLMQAKQFDQAKTYAKKLVKINRYNADAYLHIGQILASEERHSQAIRYFRLSLSLEQNQSLLSIINFQCGLSLFILGRVFEAIQLLTHSILIRPNIEAYNKLVNFYMIIGNKLSAIRCCQQGIFLDYASLLPFINLSNYAQQNTLFRAEINCFMDAISQRHPSKLHVEFNVALYYYLSKQSHSRFHELILRFLKENAEQQNQTVWEKVVFAALDEYQHYTDSFLIRNPIFSMLIGILCRAKERTKQSHRSFLILARTYGQSPQPCCSEVFDRIYLALLRGKKDCSIFLEWMATEILEQSPKQGLRCYFKALNYCQGEYEGFKQAFKRKMEDEIENGCLFAQEIMYELISERFTESQILTQKQTVFDLREYQKKVNILGLLINILRKNLQNNHPQTIQGYWEKYFGQKQQSGHIHSAFQSAIIGIKWNKSNFLKESFYCKLRQLINSSEQRLMTNLQTLASLYRNESGKMGFLFRVLLTMEEYYTAEFAANQTVKMIFNGLLPFIPCDETSYRILLAVLIKFKKDPNHNYASLEEGLKEIFLQRTQQKNNTVEYSEGMSETTQALSNEENEICFLVHGETQSQIDPFDQGSQYFFVEDIKKPRKFSESNISQLTAEECDTFIESVLKQKQNKALRIITVPLKDKDDSPSALSKQQRSQMEEDYWESDEEGYQESQCGQMIDMQEDRFSNYSSIDTVKYFQLHYSIQDTKFKDSSKYTIFKELLFQNTYHLIRYLSINSDKMHIAKHQLDHVNIQNTSKFDARVELGDAVHCPFIVENFQEKYFKWIWFLGIQHVYKWIMDIAIGIAELEELGIYHADLAFRNTIRVSHGGRSAFKIIDFEKAFRVLQTQKDDKAYDCTKQLLQFWLDSRFYVGNLRPPLGQISMSEFESQVSSSSLTYNNYRQTDIIEYIFTGADEELINELISIKNDAPFSSLRLQKCLQKLRQHMSQSHRRQYNGLVLSLLRPDHVDQYISQIPQRSISYILEELKKLQMQELDLRMFATKVRAIAETKNSFNRQFAFASQQEDDFFANQNRNYALQKSTPSTFDGGPFFANMEPYPQSGISIISTSEQPSSQIFSYSVKDSYLDDDSLLFVQIRSEYSQQQSSLSSAQDIKGRQRQLYPVGYHPYRTQFLTRRLYTKLNKLLYLNTYHLIKYLEQCNSSLNRIAKHYIQKGLTTIQLEEGFEVFVERGQTLENKYLSKGLQENTQDYLRKLGSEAVLRWVSDIGYGIAQLENLGIYHADLAFRNTIRVVKYDPQGIFKIIDFDKAFKVFPTSSNDRVFKYTEDIIDYWLKFRFDQDHPRQPTSKISFNSQKSVSQRSYHTTTIYKEGDLINYMFSGADQSLIEELKSIKHSGDFNQRRLPKCIHLIQGHMKQSHIAKFRELVHKLIRNAFKQKGYQLIQMQIRDRLGQLEKDGDYVSFARRINQIREKYFSSETSKIGSERIYQND